MRTFSLFSNDCPLDNPCCVTDAPPTDFSSGVLPLKTSNMSIFRLDKSSGAFVSLNRFRTKDFPTYFNSQLPRHISARKHRFTLNKCSLSVLYSGNISVKCSFLAKSQLLNHTIFAMFFIPVTSAKFSMIHWQTRRKLGISCAC